MTLKMPSDLNWDVSSPLVKLIVHNGLLDDMMGQWTISEYKFYLNRSTLDIFVRNRTNLHLIQDRLDLD